MSLAPTAELPASEPSPELLAALMLPPDGTLMSTAMIVVGFSADVAVTVTRLTGTTDGPGGHVTVNPSYRFHTTFIERSSGTPLTLEWVDTAHNLAPNELFGATLSWFAVAGMMKVTEGMFTNGAALTDGEVMAYARQVAIFYNDCPTALLDLQQAVRDYARS